MLVDCAVAKAGSFYGDQWRTVGYGLMRLAHELARHAPASPNLPTRHKLPRSCATMASWHGRKQSPLNLSRSENFLPVRKLSSENTNGADNPQVNPSFGETWGQS